jgi:hypothetical protein
VRLVFVQTVLGVWIISLAAGLFVSSIVRVAQNIVPINTEYFLNPAGVFLIFILPLAIGGIGLLTHKPSIAILYQSLTVIWGISYLFAVLASVVTLLLIPLETWTSSKFGGIYPFPFYVGIIGIYGMSSMLYPFSFGLNESVNLKKVVFLKQWQWLCGLIVLLMMALTLHGVLVIQQDLNFNSTTANLLSLVIPLIEALIGWVIGLSLVIRLRYSKDKEATSIQQLPI